jgi:hypothetical protein
LKAVSVPFQVIGWFTTVEIAGTARVKAFAVEADQAVARLKASTEPRPVTRL